MALNVCPPCSGRGTQNGSILIETSCGACEGTGELDDEAYDSWWVEWEAAHPQQRAKPGSIVTVPAQIPPSPWPYGWWSQ